MKIVLARHGETDWNISGHLMGQLDIPLNENGKEQAKILKENLKDINFDCCFSSPLARAKETAEIVCDKKCQIIYDDNLKERYGGKMEGKLIENWGDYVNDDTVETDAEILARAKNFIETIKESDYKTILVISHNGLLKNLRHVILEKNGKVDYDAGNFKNCSYEKYVLQF